MKKLMFASMMAVAGLAFGETTNVAGFEAFAHGATGISAYDDSAELDGSKGRFFFYQASDSSTDGSTVKAFNGEDALAAFVYETAVGVPDYFKELTNTKYLELSTEGGILWRSWVAGNGSIGEGYDLTTAYIDTLVQFTATEDDNDPSMESTDKLAIWLRVSDDGATTNLCVRAGQYNDSDVVAHTFVLTNAPAINPGTWYRLTVKAMGEIGEEIPGFQIFIDGVAMSTSDSIVTGDGDVSSFDDYEDLVAKGQIFLSLVATDSPTLSAVGFKGSGAVDDLVLTEDQPEFLKPAVTTVDFTIDLGDNVSSVTYTIGDTTATITETTKITGVAKAGDTVTFSNAVAADWYAIDTASTADYTVVADGTATITASLVESPVTGAEVAAVKGWAEKNGISYADLNASAYKTESYLLGTTELLTAAPTLKITKIEQGDENWTITVKAECNDATVTLANLNGCLKLISSDTLAGLLSAATKADLAKGTDFTTNDDGLAVVTVPAGKKFMKAAVGFAEKAE